MEKQTVNMNISLDKEQHAQFKAACALSGIKMIDVIRGCIEKFIDREKVTEAKNK